MAKTVQRYLKMVAIFLFIFSVRSMAQAPGNFAYSTPSTFTAGTTISPLSPSNVKKVASGIFTPSAVAIDAAGNVYVASYLDGTVKKINATTGSVSTYASGFITPRGIAIDGAGNVYVADYGGSGAGEIYVIISSNVYAPLSSYYGISTSFNHPTGVAIGTGGEVYVSDNTQGGGYIWKITFGAGQKALASNLNGPSGVAVDNAGNVFFPQAYSNVISTIPFGFTFPVTYAFSGFNLPSGIAVDNSGNVYVADYGNDAVKKIATDLTITTLATGLGNPEGVAVDPAGDVFIADYSANNVKEIYPVGGVVASYSISPALPTGLSFNTTDGTISGTPTVTSAATDYTITATNASGTSNSIINITVDPTTYTYIGANGGDFGTASNWSPTGVPGTLPSDNAYIPAGKSVNETNNGPSRGAFIFTNLMLDGVLDLDGGGAYITLSGQLNGAGTLEATGGNGGYINITGSGNTIGNVTVAATGSFSELFLATLSTASLTITNGLDILSETSQLWLDNVTITMGSSSAGSATFNYAHFADAINKFNPSINVERYIPSGAGASFRDLGVAVSGAKVGDLSNQVYNYSNGAWSSTLGSGISLTPGVGYRAEEPTSTTLTTSGTLKFGDVSVPLTQGANVYNFVANPYLGQLDFNKLTTANIQAGYWYLDPTNIVYDGLGNGYVGYKYFGTLTGAANTYGGGLTLSQYIQPGQGFFVQNEASGNASLTFKESAIDNSNSQTNVFGKQALNRISTGLFTGGKNIDGAVTVFNKQFSNGSDNYDGAKISNSFENITFSVGGKDLCANAWSMPTATDALSMHLYNLKAKTTYTVKLNASEFVGNGLNAYLKDNVTNTKTLLSGANNEVTFTTGTDASVYASRYSIVFDAGALPVKNINLTASKLGNNQVTVKWNTNGESNISNYKIERSSNGTNFTELASVSPSATHSYSYIDASATGTNYYRIKVIDVTGGVSYSAVAKVSTNNAHISVYPNPVTGTNFKVSLGTSGKYNVSVVNMLGQKVFSTVINHTSGTLSTVAMTKQLAAGNYHLTAVDEDGQLSTTDLIIK